MSLNSNSRKRIQLLVVTPRNVFSERLKKVVTSYNANKLVEILGFVPDKKLRDLYKNSLGFVYPSLYEGFGLPALEAMSSGSLAIVSDIPVFHEVYKNNAIYFDPYDVDSIEKSMKEVLGMSEEERKLRVQKSQNFVKKYSWSKMAEKTLKVYEEVI